ncbi:MAG: ABC transporter ATP-binding protein [Bacteroidetes bacterium]|nr:ABC transporter ATP-binding protein [Bacteroidota bacterium]
MPETASHALLSVRALSFRYDRDDIFSDVAFDLHARDVLLLSGPSGSGKSTLLRSLARLLAPQTGTITLKGRSWADIPPPTYRRRVAYLQQQPVMLPGTTVRTNLLLSFRFDVANGPDDEQLNSLLSEAALESIRLDQDAGTLSVGQQQRIALLRLLLMRPAALLLDEPTASLDRDAAQKLIDMVADERERSALAVLLVSHHTDDADRLSPRMAILKNARLEVLS